MADFGNDKKTSGLNGYMSKIDKCHYVKSRISTARMIIRKRHLYLRDYNPVTDSIELTIVMFSILKHLLELEITIDSKGYISVIFNLDSWNNYRAGKFTGEEAAKNGWENLINHIPSNAILICIDKKRLLRITVSNFEIKNSIS